MRGVFAFGDHAIVATDAIAADTLVVVAGVCPGDGVVTVIAGVRTDHMPGILAPGDHAVVAALATTDHGNVVDAEYVGPYRGGVAHLAFTDDAYVLAARSAGLDATGQRMASGALSRRTNKNALYMAGFATHHGVREIERKSRVVMIEVGTDLERIGASCTESAHYQQGHHCKAWSCQPRSGFSPVISGFHIFSAACVPWFRHSMTFNLVKIYHVEALFIVAPATGVTELPLMYIVIAMTVDAAPGFLVVLWPGLGVTAVAMKIGMGVAQLE